MATGTFQLDNQIFPKDPLTKTWARQPVGAGGRRKSLFADLWNLTLSFPALKTQTEHNFFWQKFQAGGLYDAVLPHPANGKPISVSGVAIDSYTWTFDERDNNAFAMNPRMVLSGIQATAHAIPNWFNQNYAYRAPTVTSTFTPSGTITTGDTLRFYASGSVAQNIFNKSAVSGGKDVRIVWAQDQRELARDLRIWSTNVIEILWKAQESQLVTSEQSGQYYIYYGNPQAMNPPNKLGDVYTRYHDFESLSALDNLLNTNDAHNLSGEQAAQGAQSTLGHWGAGTGKVNGVLQTLSADFLNVERLELTIDVYIDSITTSTQDYLVGIMSSGANRAGVQIDNNDNIYWSGVSGFKTDTGSNVITGQWNEFRCEAVGPVTGTGVVWLNGILIYTGGDFTPDSGLDGFNSRWADIVSDGSGSIRIFIDNVRLRAIARVEPDITLDSEESVPV